MAIEKTPAHGDEQGRLYAPTYLTPEKYMNPELSGLTVAIEKTSEQQVEFDIPLGETPPKSARNAATIGP